MSSSTAAAGALASGSNASTSHAATGLRQTDVRKRTVLPTTLQNMRTSAITGSSGVAAGAGMLAGGLELNSDEYLDKMEEELNRKVDADTEVLVDGMAELVRMTKIEGKDHYRVAQEAFQAECRTESMTRAAHSLLSLSHTLKLLHLFADTATPVATRDRLSAQLEQDIAELKAKIGTRSR